jgi:flagellin
MAQASGQAPAAGTHCNNSTEIRRISMALGVLNNISAIYAQNNLANTQASLSKTLQQLSSGSRINSGADDAAGLSLANGLQASATALSQSAKNAAEGVDMLQVADGALSQVTSLLNRAITLATEASNGTLNSSQQTAADSEYQKILSEVDTINQNTEYNGINVFRTGTNSSAVAIFTSDGTLNSVYNNSSSDLVAADTSTLGIGNSIAISGTFKAGATAPGATSAITVTDAQGNDHDLTVTLTATADGNTFAYKTTAADGETVSGGSGAITFDSSTGKVTGVTGDPITLSGQVGGVDFGTFSTGLTFANAVLGTTASTNAAGSVSTSNLLNATNAQDALAAINQAITAVAADRGKIGANINTLSAVSNVMTTQSTNTLAAENDVTATDYGQATSDMSKFQILSQTGIAALSQANQSQQLITKLLQ